MSHALTWCPGLNPGVMSPAWIWAKNKYQLQRDLSRSHTTADKSLLFSIMILGPFPRGEINYSYYWLQPPPNLPRSGGTDTIDCMIVKGLSIIGVTSSFPWGRLGWVVLRRRTRGGWSRSGIQIINCLSRSITYYAKNNRNPKFFTEPGVSCQTTHFWKTVLKCASKSITLTMKVNLSDSLPNWNWQTHHIH